MKPLVVVGCVLLGVALGLRDPYTRIEAESLDVNHGAVIFESSIVSGSKYIQHIQPGDYAGYKQLNFSTETVAIEWFTFSGGVRNPLSRVSLRLDTPTATPFLTYSIDNVHAEWLTSIRLIPIGERPRGVHDLYFTFQHPTATSDLIAIDWFRFVTLDSLLPPSCNAGTAIDCPVACTQPNVQPTTDLQPQVSVDHCDNSTQSHKQITINIY